MPKTDSKKKSAIGVLSNFADCDIMDYDEMLDIINMKKSIQQARKKHNHEIHHTEKSGWFTVVDDVTAPTGKRKIRKCSEEKLWNALAEWYIDNLHMDLTLRELFDTWLKWKTTPYNQSTIKRLQKSWEAYYLNEPLSQKLLDKSVSKITALELREWAESLMRKYLPDKKKFSRIFTIINQCMEYASDEDRAIIPENTWQKARKKLNKALIVQTPIATDESQVFSDTERKEIQQMVREDLIRYKKQASSAGLQILLLFETGMRIGECCGLKWSDIQGNRLYIQRQADNETVKEKTKTASSFRDIPLTEEALRILEEVKRFNEEHGYNREWVFQSNNPKYDYRLSYNAADRKLRKLCARLDTVMKSPHKCRKTCISTLLDSPNINNRTVQRFAGHHDINTTLKFYSYERKSKEEQAIAINEALKL